MSTPATFRAIWPIVDQTKPWASLITEARNEIPFIAARAHARIDTTRGRFSIAPSAETPGSGQVTSTCLIYEAPAKPASRPYHRRTA